MRNFLALLLLPLLAVPAAAEARGAPREGLGHERARRPRGARALAVEHGVVATRGDAVFGRAVTVEIRHRGRTAGVAEVLHALDLVRAEQHLAGHGRGELGHALRAHVLDRPQPGPE